MNRCLVPHCRTPPPADNLLCGAHWHATPFALQRRLLWAWRRWLSTRGTLWGEERLWDEYVEARRLVVEAARTEETACQESERK